MMRHPRQGARPRAQRDAYAGARLAAALLLATWTTALVQAHAAFAARQDASAARAVFLALVDRGSRGVEAALAGTPPA